MISTKSNAENDMITVKEPVESQITFVPKEVKKDPLELKKMKMSPTGELSLKFSKPMFIRSVKEAQGANKGRGLEDEEIDVNDAVTVNIEGAQDEYDLDKSIVNVRVKKSSETEVSL